MTNEAVISVVGGTGKLGAAIARRLAKAGRTVIIGSRSAENAQKAAAELGFGITGKSNADAAQAGDIVIVTVPFQAQDATLAEIRPFVQGKIVVDTTVPLVPPRSEEHTSELQSLMRISYAVFCLKNKQRNNTPKT